MTRIFEENHAIRRTKSSHRRLVATEGAERHCKNDEIVEKKNTKYQQVKLTPQNTMWSISESNDFPERRSLGLLGCCGCIARASVCV